MASHLTNFTAAAFSAFASGQPTPAASGQVQQSSTVRVAAAGATLPAEPTVKTSTTKGANDFTALGYVPSPETPWAPGQVVTVGTHDFHWDGQSWQPGSAAAPVEPVEPEPVTVAVED